MLQVAANEIRPIVLRCNLLRSFFLVMQAHHQANLIITNAFREHGLNAG
jgi:hypothetical protein